VLILYLQADKLCFHSTFGNPHAHVALEEFEGNHHFEFHLERYSVQEEGKKTLLSVVAAANVSFELLFDADVTRAYHQWWYNQERASHTTWMGVKAMKSPQDM
jgi:hypothetical protein